MADAEKQTLTKIAKLMERLRELQAQEYELTDEIRRLAGGGAGIGPDLKRAMAAFDASWCARYAPGLVGRYIWQGVRDVPAVKRLIKAIGVEELETRMARYVVDDDPFYVKARHPFGLFVANVNRFAAPAAAGGSRAQRADGARLQTSTALCR
jgi:hypothetical protein